MHANVARSGEASKRLTQAVLEHYGVVCWLQLPGCTMRATTKDHVIAVEQGGTDAMENLRPACSSCNSKRRNLSIGGVPGGILVTFHIGPLIELCSAEARRQALPGDVVIAPDVLLDAITPLGGSSTAARRVGHRVFNAAVQQALRMRYPCHVRIAHPVPTAKQLQMWARLRYFTDVHDPGREHAERTATHQGRDELLEVGRWYDRYPEGHASVERVRAHRPTVTVSSDASSTAVVQASRAW